MRSNAATVLERIEAVFDLLLGGAEFHDLRRFASEPEQNWGVSDRQLQRYVTQANAMMVLRFDAKAEHLISRHLLQRRRLYAHAMEVGDYRTALAILSDEAKLEGLYPAEKTKADVFHRHSFALEDMVAADKDLRELEQTHAPDRNGTAPGPRVD